jgi:RNA polymerase sigma factor (TIGR02999 family)
VTSDRDLTGLLQAWSEGDRDALAVLATVVHQDLRAIARRLLADERRDGRWRPTELVQESYLRLLDWRGVHGQNRAHFFATAARMMRRVLVDAARARQAIKRGEGIDAMPLDGVDVAASTPPVDMIALEEALEALAKVNRGRAMSSSCGSSADSASRRPQKRWDLGPNGHQRLEHRARVALS